MSRIDLLSHLNSIFEKQAFQQCVRDRRVAQALMNFVLITNDGLDVQLVAIRSLLVLEILIRGVPGLLEEILLQPLRSELSTVTRVDLIAKQPEFMETQPLQHRLRYRLSFEQLHVTRQQGDVALSFLTST